MMQALEDQSKMENQDENRLLGEAIKVEDEIRWVFGIKSQELTKAIIDFDMEDEFQL